MAVEPRLIDDGADTSERRVAMLRYRVAEQGHRAGIGAGQAEQYPDECRLAGAVGAEVAERRSPRDQELDTVHRDFRPEALGQPVGLHGPAGLAGHPGGVTRDSRGNHRRRGRGIGGPSLGRALVYEHADTKTGTSTARGWSFASPDDLTPGGG